MFGIYNPIPPENSALQTKLVLLVSESSFETNVAWQARGGIGQRGLQPPSHR